MTTERKPDCPVVGIGSSAGGVEALKAFFSAVPADSGAAYVVVQHLDPHARSVLTDLLGRAAKIPVSVIEHGVRIAPNHAYVIPPNASVTIDGCRLVLVSPVEPRGQRTPIDTFFASLAHDQAENAACVILSGTGSDGTAGLRAIKSNGGLTLAQEGAEYDGMMRSALGTGLVDFVLPAERMAATVVNYFRHHTDLAQAEVAPAEDLMRICAILRARTGHDFSNYKDKTILRRIQRRMQVLQIPDVPQLIARLRKEPREVDLLFQDLLIGVTNFFRDPDAFAALERAVIPALFADKGADEAVRVWVPGCATGEEAYSIAMLLRERAPRPNGAPKLQIFASDIDEHALEIARIGRYPASIARDVPPRHLEQFFVREDGTYRIAANLREICLFSLHNLLRDAPFSKVDLVSCRNLLIYLNPELQNRVIPLFHYALRDPGFLFLGSSENVSRHARLFSTVDKTHRLFRRRAVADRRLPVFPLSAPNPARHKHEGALRAAADGGLQAIAERKLLERYAPAYVVTNGEGDVLLTSGRTGKYLELPAGAPQNNLFSMARQGLRADLRAALHKASSTGHAAVQSNISLGTNGGRQKIDLHIQPMRADGGREALYLVVFQDIGGIVPGEDAEGAQGLREAESASLQQMEEELRSTTERLQTTTEELESSNEELKSSNEELSSMNEELQSANEELETSREELQSINEELQTVNAELNARVEDLGRANSDIANLLESTQIATLFLDHQLNVKTFTPAAKDVFRLVESDVGRPISHVRTRIDHDALEEDAERVLRTLTTIERQVDTAEGNRHYIMRIMPYRTVENVINGVVLTFTDITEITEAQRRIAQLVGDLRDRADSLETLLDLIPVGVFIVEDGGAGRVNRHGALLIGQAPGGQELRSVSAAYRLFHGEREIALAKQPFEMARGGERTSSFEARLLRADASARHVFVSAQPLLDAAGKVRGAIAAMADITARKESEEKQDVLLHELEHRVKNILATVASLASRMLRDSPSLAVFSETFQARLRVMGATHDILSHGKWEGASLSSLISRAAEAYGNKEKGNFGLHGPDTTLKPAQAATLALVFHELATNAAKYGAFSTPKGRVAVSWNVERGEHGPEVALKWREYDGPPVQPPKKENFGLEFVRRSITYELQGSADLAFAPDGLSCSLRFPLETA
jgi:two-component system, chemotaxis family, CheB/CheR fusion protein